MSAIPPLIPSSQNFSSTVINGNLDIFGKISFQTGSCVGLIITGTPTNDNDAVNKQYVDNNSGGGGDPSGITGSIQFNNNGAFDGSSLLTWTSTSNVLDVNGIVFTSSSLISTVTTSDFNIQTIEFNNDNFEPPVNLNLKTGNSPNYSSGSINISSGTGILSGSINISSGSCEDITGDIQIKTGNSVNENSGSLTLETGSGSSGGPINIIAGQNLSGVRGQINMRGFLTYFNNGFITFQNENLSNTGYSSRIINFNSINISPLSYQESSELNTYVKNDTYNKSIILLSIVLNTSSTGIPSLIIKSLTHETLFTYRIYNSHPTESISGNISVGYIIFNNNTTIE